MKEVPEKKPTNDHRTGPDGPAPRTDAPGPSGALAPHHVQRLQGAVGNAAVARLVAQRHTAPVKTPPNAAPGFRRVGADVAAKKRTLAAHAPAAAESKSAQDAAVAPPDDKEAQGKAANAEKMNAAKPGEFDKAAFVAAVDKAIEAQAPKNLDEADKFSKSGKADKVKDEADGKVTDGKNTSAKDIETTTKAPPDTSAAKDKPVTPMTPDNAPGNPGAPSAADAIPEKQPPAVTDFSQGPAENDKAMADAEVTEEQLAKGNEPEFDDALKAKKTAETDSAKAPGKAHTAEDQQLATAKAGAAAAGAQAMNTLTATRAAAGKAVDGGKGETKSKDERKRAEVTAKLQKVFDATKKDVESTLTGLDQKVDTAFTTGEKSARDAFTADHKARMKKYKDKRYGGFLGKGRWLKDKFAGMPQEANDLYQESRKLYVARMRTVISSVADMIGVELGRAKTRIAQGRSDLKAEVDKLPADLKSFGEEAQQDFAGKFEDLEASVDEKSQQLVQDLANKYTAALNAVDEEIKKLQEANKGLIDKAKDAIVGVIKTINELKNLLLGILAKAASAIMKIIKDPIGFLGNLVKAVGAGLNLFVANIGDHLKKGLVSWLLGTATKAGLEIPERFDLRGIITLITSLLGLTWDNIRTRITRKGVPEEAMTAVETSVPVAQSLAKEGPAGAVKEIEAEAGDLKSTILSKLTEYLVPTVIIAGVTWILSLLNPASAFVRAVKGIIDIVTFVVNQGAQIADFVNAVLDAVIEIANGGAAGVPKMVETALAASIPLLIGFLAALLGIGNLANKVKSVFQAVSKPVNRAIDKIVDFIAKKGKALWQKLKGKKDGKVDDTRSRDVKRKAREMLATRTSEPFKNKNELDTVLRDIFKRLRPEGLVRLRAKAVGQGRFDLIAKASPEQEVGQASVGNAGSEQGSSRAEELRREGEILDGIRHYLPIHANKFLLSVYKNWWEGQLSKSKVNSKNVWSADILPSSEIAARDFLNEPSTHARLLPHFNQKDRKLPYGHTDEFAKYVFVNSMNSGSSVRLEFLKHLGDSALPDIKSKGSTSIAALEPDTAKQDKLLKELGKVSFDAGELAYGKFSPLPNGRASADKKLKDAVEDRGIIDFLKDMVKPGSSGGISRSDLKGYWDGNPNEYNPNREFLKEEFRKVRPRHHEWIPTDYMMKMVETAVSQGSSPVAMQWIDLQDNLRSFTAHVIWKVRVVGDPTATGSHVLDAHAGAFFNEDGNFIFNGRDGEWHKSLREYFDRFIVKHPNGTPKRFLSLMTALLKRGRLMWNGDDSGFTDDQRKIIVKATYKAVTISADGVVERESVEDLKLSELATRQRINYEIVEDNFKEAGTGLL
ncbi:phage tail protein [Streptomyces hydrogenans]|uniref:phage tail protein n=1 Tax=Streptomyces hydrogenans TaxID=1873719 RepID=UPI0033BC5DBF